MQRITTAFRRFADYHDHLPAFHAGYIILVLLTAALFNLGTFAVLIGLHMLLDVVKFRDLPAAKRVRVVLHDSLTEMTLFTVALVFSIYVHHSASMVAVSGVARAEIAFASLLGIVLPKYAILEGVLKVLAHVTHAFGHLRSDVRRGFSMFDRFSVCALAACFALIALSPMMTGTDPKVVGMLVLWELNPLHG